MMAKAGKPTENKTFEMLQMLGIKHTRIHMAILFFKDQTLML